MRLPLLTIFSFCLALSACQLYHVPVQQGNILTAKQIQQVHIGMSRTDVQGLLGEPVLDNTFNDNRWHYVYTYKKGAQTLQRRNMTIIFSNDKVSQILGNYGFNSRPTLVGRGRRL